MAQHHQIGRARPVRRDPSTSFRGTFNLEPSTFNRFKAALPLLALLFTLPLPAATALFQQIGNTLVMSNANVRLEYNLAAGTTDFYWNHSKKITGFYGGVGLSTGYIKSLAY